MQFINTGENGYNQRVNRVIFYSTLLIIFCAALCSFSNPCDVLEAEGELPVEVEGLPAFLSVSDWNIYKR